MSDLCRPYSPVMDVDDAYLLRNVARGVRKTAGAKKAPQQVIDAAADLLRLCDECLADAAKAAVQADQRRDG